MDCEILWILVNEVDCLEWGKRETSWVVGDSFFFCLSVSLYAGTRSYMRCSVQRWSLSTVFKV